MSRAALVLLVALHATGRADGLADIEAAIPACDAERTSCFGLRLHVVDREGGTVASAAWIAAQVALANKHFAGVDIAFEASGVDALPASAAHVVTRRDRNALADGEGRLGGGVIHVYVVGALDDVDVPGEARNGVAWRLPRDSRKYIIIAATALPLTLAHELGHVFGLPHSTYVESIMNKTRRAEPPPEERGFAEPERKKIRAHRERLVRGGVLVPVRRVAGERSKAHPAVSN
jgi:hypothetical protein